MNLNDFYAKNITDIEPAWLYEITDGWGLVMGDNTAVMDQIPDGAVDLIVTSPPYPGLRGAAAYTVNLWYSMMQLRFERIGRILNPDHGVMCLNVMFPRDQDGWFDTNLFHVPHFLNDLNAPLKTADILIWDKMNPAPAGDMARHDIPAWEPIFVMVRPGYNFSPWRTPYSEKTKGKSKKGNKTRAQGVGNSYTGGHGRLHPQGAQATNVLRISSSGDQGRPRAKGGSFPRQLAARLISQYVPQNKRPQDVVIFDPFCGVGTTVYEALRLGYSSFGCDLDPDAIFAGNKWIAELAAQPRQPRLV